MQGTSPGPDPADKARRQRLAGLTVSTGGDAIGRRAPIPPASLEYRRPPRQSPFGFRPVPALRKHSGNAPSVPDWMFRRQSSAQPATSRSDQSDKQFLMSMLKTVQSERVALGERLAVAQRVGDDLREQLRAVVSERDQLRAMLIARDNDVDDAIAPGRLRDLLLAVDRVGNRLQCMARVNRQLRKQIGEMSGAGEMERRWRAAATIQKRWRAWVAAMNARDALYERLVDRVDQQGQRPAKADDASSRTTVIVIVASGLLTLVALAAIVGGWNTSHSSRHTTSQ
ncbi:Uncharacterized protein PBTT_06444 [Plasmodiophora brassicae]